MLGLLNRELPSSVEVDGETVELCCGFRTGIKAFEFLNDKDESTMFNLLYLFYGLERDDGLLELPEVVAAHAKEAAEESVEWLLGAFQVMDYDNASMHKRRSNSKQNFSFTADEAIIYADFRRFYGIDLMNSETQMHWYQFIALLLSAMRTEGSLTGTAIAAREPIPGNAKGHERERLRKLQKAWALPMTENELLQRALEMF